MNFLIYLLETSICLIVFYLLYSLFLRKLTHFQWSRFYLLGSLILSLALPGLNIQLTQAQTPIQFELSQYLPDNNKVEFDNKEPKDIQLSVEENIQIPIENKGLKKAENFNWIPFILLIYFLGVLVAGLRFFIGFRKLIALIKTSSGEKMQEFVWLKMPEGFQPSSFFHWVLMDEEKLKEKEVLRHELTHVKQWHSLDVLLLEFSAIFLWFNPIIYFIKKDLRQIHEYLADTIAMGENPKYYAQKMLELATGNKPFLLTNSFAFLPLKHRIKMLTKIKSSPVSKLNFVLSLPVIGLLFFTFSCVKEDFADITGSEETAQRKIKSIKSYYVDEMGDQPEKNGAVIGEVHFDMEGKIGVVNSDYSIYLKQPNYFNSERINLNFLINPKDAVFIIEEYRYEFTPIEITNSEVLLDYFYQNTAEFQEISDVETKYSVDNEIKLKGMVESIFIATKETLTIKNGKWSNLETRTSTNGEEIFNSIYGVDIYQEEFENNQIFKRYRITNDGQKEYTQEAWITYNDSGLIDSYAFINNSKTIRKLVYQYNDKGLRTSSMVYNTIEDLEYSINFEYEFYD